MISISSLPLYRKYLIPFLFSKSPFKISCDGFHFLIKPRSYEFYVLGEVFGDKDYESKYFSFPPRIDTIVDLGACCGEFSIWAVKRFDPKRVIAVEMEEENFQNMSHNIQMNHLEGTITPLNFAVFSRNTTIGIKRSTSNSGNHRIADAGSGSIRAVTLARLLRSSGIEKVDFLKMDIEGAEKYLLTKENESLFKNRISFVLMESHQQDDFNKLYPLEYFANLGFQVRHRKQLFKRPVMIEALNQNLRNSQ